MPSAFLIAKNDLRLFLRNASSWVWLVVVPVMFVYFMGLANRAPGGPLGAYPAVVVENKDEGHLGQAFLDALGWQGLRVVSPTNTADAGRGLRIPADFTRTILAGKQGQIDFYSLPGSGDASAVLVRAKVLRAMLSLNSDLIELTLATDDRLASGDALKALQQRPPLVSVNATHAGRKPMPTGYNLSLPGVLVMYGMMNLLIFGGSGLAANRRTGVLRRMEALPIPRSSLVLGKILGLMLLGAVQAAIILLSGKFLFRVHLGDQPLALLLVIMIYSWVAASLGVLVGSLVRAEDKVIGVCLLASLAMAALGGCWWPLEVVPDFARVLAHCVPTGWAMDALHQLITFGAPISATAVPLAALCGFGLIANFAAAKLFRT